MAPRRAPAAALMDEIVEDILLRIPPDDPASLLRAALVCKQWGRVASDPGFRSRFAEFHRTPPMLGFLCSRRPRGGRNASFVSTTSFRPSPFPIDYEAVDARHGRVLLYSSSWSNLRFVVWDPMAGGERAGLPLLPRSNSPSNSWNAAVLCADDACDHLDCRGGPFLVVFVSSAKRWGRSGICALVYSSETAAWSQPIYAPHLVEDIHLVPSALAGNSLFYSLASKHRVLKFDVATREMSLIDLPRPHFFGRPILRVTADGGLGLARICRDELQLWSRQIGPDENLVWAQSKVIKLKKLLHASSRLTGSAHGLDVVLVSTNVGDFTIHLNSVQVTKVSEDSWFGGFTFPYMSFYTPALGAAASAK